MAVHWINLTETVDPGWWGPLEALAERLAADPEQPPIDLDDYLYVAWARPDSGPYIHVYRNLLTGRYISVDQTGRLWVRVRRTKDDPDGYAPAADVADGLARADLVRAELLAAHTRRGARRPGWAPPGAAPAAAPAPGDHLGVTHEEASGAGDEVTEPVGA